MYDVGAQGIDEHMINVHYYVFILWPVGKTESLWSSICDIKDTSTPSNPNVGNSVQHRNQCMNSVRDTNNLLRKSIVNHQYFQSKYSLLWIMVLVFLFEALRVIFNLNI